jgi:hypothetical protein
VRWSKLGGAAIGRVLGIGLEVCSACGNGTLSHLCRPLICKIDEDCPIFRNRRLGPDPCPGVALTSDAWCPQPQPLPAGCLQP